MNRPSVLLRWSVLVTLMILADQGTKWMARRYLLQHAITAGPVGLVLTMNKGVAFGLFGGRQWVMPVNAVLGMGVCVAAIAALRRGDLGLAHGFLLVFAAVSYTHLRAHETRHDLVCRLLLEKKKNKKHKQYQNFRYRKITKKQHNTTKTI